MANERDPLLNRAGFDDRVSPPARRYCGANASPRPIPDAEDAADEAPCPMRKQDRWVLLIVVWGGVLLQGIDTTIVAAMATGIGNSFDQLHRAAWINTAYLLTHATCTPFFGKVSDTLGRRTTANVAWNLFILGGLLSGLAPSMELLIVARLIQGCGGGGLAITASCVLSDTCSLRDRAMVSAVGGIAWAVGCGLGGPFGGLCAESLGWRWAFLLQLPLMLVCHILTQRRLTYRLPSQAENVGLALRQIDWLGTALLIVSVGGLVVGIGLRTNDQAGWTDPVLVSTLSLSLLAFMLFLPVELRHAKDPVVAFHLLADRNRLACTLTNFLCAASTIASPLYFPMLLIVVRRESPAMAGLNLVPAVMLGCVGGLSAGYAIKRSGRYRSLTTASSLLLVPSLLLLSRVGEQTTESVTWCAMIPSHLTTAALYSSVNVAMLAEVAVDQFGTALGLMVLLRALGQVLGLAGASAAQQSSLDADLPLVLDDHRLIEAIRRSASVIDTLPPATQDLVRAAFGDSIRIIFRIAAAIACATFLATIFIKEMPLKYTAAKGKREDGVGGHEDADGYPDAASAITIRI